MTHRIETVNYTSSMARDLATFFADLVGGVPHCRSLTPDEIDFAVGGNERRKNRRIQPEVKLVAVSGSEVVGLALIGQGRTGTMRPTGRGIVRFLGYKRGCRRAGQMLLNAVESHALENNASSLTIFSRNFPFFRSLPQASLSNHLAHVQGLLTARGYVRSKGHVILEWPCFPQEPVPTSCPLDFRSETVPEDGDMPALRVTSFLNASEVGVYFSRPFRTSEVKKGEGPWLCVNDVDVVEAEQGKGYGWLTLQRGLYDASQLGYRSAIIGTNENNGPALSLYANMGFRPVDWTYDFHRDLQSNP